MFVPMSGVLSYYECFNLLWPQTYYQQWVQMQEPKKPIRIVAPPPPVLTGNYLRRAINKKLNGPQQTKDAIKKEVAWYTRIKATKGNFLDNITISPYWQEDSEGNKRVYEQIYTLKIKGRNEPGFDYFKNKVISGRLEFPDTYPADPPIVIFDILPNSKTPLLLVNVYTDGQVSHPTVGSDYQYPRFNLPNILRGMQDVLYSPNPNSPANGLLGEYYDKWPDGYEQFMRDQAKLLKDSEQ